MPDFLSPVRRRHENRELIAEVKAMIASQTNCDDPGCQKLCRCENEARELIEKSV